MKKGVTFISAVIFLAFSVGAVTVIYQAAVPVVDRMQAAAAIDDMRSNFIEIDKIISEVASEGKGSKRTIFINPEPGTLYVNGSSDVIYWLYETSALIFSPRTSQTFGNVRIGSNLDTSAAEGSYDGNNAYVLENEHLIVYLNRTGNSSTYADLRTTDLLLAVYQKDLQQYMNLTNLNITVDDRPDSSTGNGYTFILEAGNNLPYGTVSAYVNSTYLAYFINFTLESGTDFLEIEVTT
ncbi:MAG: hypothetical protein KKC05_02150 [Nanoarchaeota archaeon]|nr:hypothetical protein [Nanoarchaeota archaeon]